LQNIKAFGKINSSNNYKNEIYKSFKSSSIIKDDINKMNNIIGWIKEKTNKEVINFEIFINIVMIKNQL